MNRVLGPAVAVALLAGSVFWPAAASAAPSMVRAIVVLRAQADPAGLIASGRRQRRLAVERRLRDHAAASQRGVLDLLDRRRRQGSVAAVEPFWIFSGMAVTATPAVLRELARRPDVRTVRPELTLRAQATVATAQSADSEPNIARVAAPALWNLGVRGQGTVVASLDTGVDVNHPDLAGRWRGGTNSWFDPNGQHPAVPTDVSGHGTSTMGLIVGGGAGGTAIGMAPDATWIAAKIFDDSGTATSTGIHRAMQWLLDPDGNPATADAPDVVNNSWSLASGGCNLDFQLDLRSLRQAGILPVFSAGNSGPLSGTVFSPANNPEAFAVGSVDATDTVDPSSGRGPSACGGGVVPRLVAPGVGVRSADLFGLYSNGSGTSLAAPHVSGALALLLSAFPDASADRQAAALEHGAVDLGVAGTDNNSGAGRLDALAAYQWLTSTPDFSVATAPASVSAPAGSSVRYTVTVTRVNGFTGSVGLSLDGMPGAQGTWSFAPSTLGPGESSAQLTITSSAGLAGGAYSFRVLGTSGTNMRDTFVSLLVPDFSVAVSPASRTISVGGSTTYSVTVASVGGFAGPVQLAVTGLPAGATATLSRTAPLPGQSSLLTVRTAASTPRGTYVLRVSGTNGALSRAGSATLTVR